MIQPAHFELPIAVVVGGGNYGGDSNDDDDEGKKNLNAHSVGISSSNHIRLLLLLLFPPKIANRR